MRFKDKAYVIHTMPYKETSAIVRLLSAESGLMSGVVKGFQGKSRPAARCRSVLQVGNLVEFQWQGKSSLKTIVDLELAAHLNVPSARKFLCLSYVNELLSCLLPEEQQVENIFICYQEFLRHIHEDMHEDGNEGSDQGVNDDVPVDQHLRRFELGLLENSGYGIDFSWDAERQSPIDETAAYTVLPAAGVRLAREHDHIRIPGADLLSISRLDFSGSSTLASAKKINRLLIDYHLEGRTLKTRKMYQDLFGR